VNQEITQEDQTILDAIEALERGYDPSAVAPRGDETAEMLARLYTEVLGLIPCELAPEAPSPDLKERLMAAVTAAPGAAPARPLPEPVIPEPVIPAPVIPGPTPTAASAPSEAPAPPVSVVPRQPPRPKPLSAARRPLGWLGALAAGLVLALAGLSGWLWMQQVEQREQIANLEREVASERAKQSQAAQQAERYRAEFTELRTRLTLVTAPAALVGPLRPVGAAPLQPDARGALFVAPDHQHWHLSIEGLKPAVAGKVYQLWFVADQGPPISGGTFIAVPNERIEMSSEAMPPGTKSAMVTLEERGGARTPSGPEVLRAAGMIQIL
jgi:hypothetical protein